eukprot:CAMPEP_0204318542 /NCGR_PEP_ID=MMETSP0469-20131031/6595_1 /ASSEMBLY_ACC=CAM_ASM_000384 /TAXON_ID=2969 /ORGANISM="Oxyrrhis marina" /LENGTH=188 /DNA_ID=CAMNT_0051299609 /DNA_START=14 /DNA_END=577 /DNA_ORIENTATION=+
MSPFSSDSPSDYSAKYLAPIGYRMRVYLGQPSPGTNFGLFLSSSSNPGWHEHRVTVKVCAAVPTSFFMLNSWQDSADWAVSQVPTASLFQLLHFDIGYAVTFAFTPQTFTFCTSKLLHLRKNFPQSFPLQIWEYPFPLSTLMLSWMVNGGVAPDRSNTAAAPTMKEAINCMAVWAENVFEIPTAVRGK